MDGFAFIDWDDRYLQFLAIGPKVAVEDNERNDEMFAGSSGWW